jgi:signal peptidase I
MSPLLQKEFHLASDKENLPQKSVVREYVEAILIAVLLALFIRTFVVQAFKIPSGSMIPTLVIGDHILVNKFIYGIRNPFTGKVLIPIAEPDRHDIIVFRYPVNPSQDFIKRVVGVEGDHIEIIDKEIYINNERFDVANAIYLEERIIPGHIQPRDNFGPIVVPENSLFVMGDNRDNSHDSRFWGFVDLQEVRGKAFLIYWSWNSDEFSVRWNRLGNIVR